MTFNYKTGLLRIWLVLSLAWLALTAWAGLTWGVRVGAPLIFGIVLCLIVWAIRGFAVKDRSTSQAIDLKELRQSLASTQAENPELYKTELEPLLERLEARYGNSIPLSELDGLRQFAGAKLIELEERRQAVIDREASRGATIEVKAIRRNLEASKAAYAGPDRDAYVKELDDLLESLAAKYGSCIPVDEAYRIMRKLESGPELHR